MRFRETIANIMNRPQQLVDKCIQWRMAANRRCSASGKCGWVDKDEVMFRSRASGACYGRKHDGGA